MGWSQHHPIGLIYSTPQYSYRGYTLISNNRGQHAYLIDLDGQVCHRWQSDEGISYCYLLDNGNLLLRTGAPKDADGAETIGGSSGALLELDWDSNVVWEYRNPYLHHDYERLPNGNTLILLFELLSPELTSTIKGGRATDDDPKRMFGDVVKEITSDGLVVYEWKSWEHLNPHDDPICPLEDRKEWTHGNSLNVTPEGDLIVSYRRISTVGIVDKNTGEFRWKWGRGEIDHQHHPTWLDSGNILIFDNGFHRPRSSYSRVIEVNPSTNEIAWEYQGNPAISFYSQAISSSERLPNGNTLICEGSPGRIFEVTSNKEIVWEYINPFFVPGGGNGNPELINGVFRAHRYGPDHPALINKEMNPDKYGNINRLYSNL